MTDIVKLAKFIEPEVKALGYELVRVAMTGGTSDPTLQVMAERPDTHQLDLGDCETISRRLSELFDENDPIEGSYRLEVSSPGIDRPLTRPRDYEQWKGHEARLKLKETGQAGKQLSGRIDGIDKDVVLLTTPKGAREIPFEDIASAKLVLTDALIRATAPLNVEGADEIITQEG